MKVTRYKNIELIIARRRMHGHNTPDTLAKIKQGREFVYIMPYGEDYECEGGHHTEILNQAEFDSLYSLVQLP